MNRYRMTAIAVLSIYTIYALSAYIYFDVLPSEKNDETLKYATIAFEIAMVPSSLVVGLVFAGFDRSDAAFSGVVLNAIFFISFLANCAIIWLFLVHLERHKARSANKPKWW